MRSECVLEAECRDHREYIPHLPDGHGVHHASQGQQQLPSGAHEEGQTATES